MEPSRCWAERQDEIRTGNIFLHLKKNPKIDIVQILTFVFLIIVPAGFSLIDIIGKTNFWSQKLTTANLVLLQLRKLRHRK